MNTLISIVIVFAWGLIVLYLDKLQRETTSKFINYLLEVVLVILFFGGIFLGFITYD